MRELMIAPEFDRAAIEAMHTKMLDAKEAKGSFTYLLQQNYV